MKAGSHNRTYEAAVLPPEDWLSGGDTRLEVADAVIDAALFSGQATIPAAVVLPPAA